MTAAKIALQEAFCETFWIVITMVMYFTKGFLLISYFWLILVWFYVLCALQSSSSAPV